MRQIAYLVALLVALWPCSILAQDGVPSTHGSLVASRPQKCRYWITYSYTEPLAEMAAERKAELPKSHHPRRLLRVEGALDGKLRREVRHWSDGASTECWAFGNVTLYEQPGIDHVLMVDPSAFTGELGVPAWFPEFAWISQKTMQAEEKGTYKGRKAVHYKAGDEEAWIDPETRLPIALRERGALREYQFSGEAPTPLTLPPRFQVFLKELEALRNKPPGDV
jgi:hypothetical protein